MNWGKSIILAFVLFAAFITVLVTVCVRQEISLVAKDYYRDELAYDEQIDRMRNAESLASRPTFEVAHDGNLEVRFDQFDAVETGEVYLFCPSNAHQDRRFKLQRGSSDVQRFTLNNAAHGMYKARMQWTMGGKEFFVERLITL